MIKFCIFFFQIENECGKMNMKHTNLNKFNFHGMFANDITCVNFLCSELQNRKMLIFFSDIFERTKNPRIST